MDHFVPLCHTELGQLFSPHFIYIAFECYSFLPSPKYINVALGVMPWKCKNGIFLHFKNIFILRERNLNLNRRFIAIRILASNRSEMKNVLQNVHINCCLSMLPGLCSNYISKSCWCGTESWLTKHAPSRLICESTISAEAYSDLADKLCSFRYSTTTHPVSYSYFELGS